ncbi:MAG: hypothetical protein R8M14_09425 [Ghiorsea sp.]
MSVFSLEFSERLKEAAEGFISKDSVAEEAGRAVLYLSLLSCEVSIKAMLERAGFEIKEIRSCSHGFKKLRRCLYNCNLQGTAMSGSRWRSASGLAAQEVRKNITVGSLLDFEDWGGSKYPNEIRYGDKVASFSPILMFECAKVTLEWAKLNSDKIFKK